MTAKYKIQFNKKYLKDLEKIPAYAQKQISAKVLALGIDPRPEGCKKLHGSGNTPLYRIRAGDYRVIYTINDDILLVLVIEVGHRKEIYR